jgi:glycosyltransferase involved in cell wall biosynthesis
MVYDYLSKQSFDWELLLSDDGSSDGTTEQLENFASTHPHVRLLANKHRGKGPTVISGLLAATGKLRLFTDFDQATPIVEVKKLIKAIKNGADIAIGSREGEGAQRKKEPIHRHLMGRVFNLIVQIIAIRGIRDTQCGFKLFTQQAAKELCPRIVVYGGNVRKDAFTGAFDVELLYLAQKAHMHISEIPVMWKHVKTDRVDPLKDSVRMLIDLVKIRLADMQGKYR